MTRLIDADEIYKEIIQNEDLARDRVISTEEMIGDRVNPMFTRYCAQLNERTMFKHKLVDAPVIDAVSVVRCKDCEHYQGLAECEIIGTCMGTNGYCAWGKRK
jgi:hypothetical protein